MHNGTIDLPLNAEQTSIRTERQGIIVIICSTIKEQVDELTEKKAKLLVDIDLRDEFMIIEKQDICVPCLYKEDVVYLSVNNEFAIDPLVTQQESARLIEAGFPSDQLPQLIANARSQLQSGGKRPPFFPLAWAKKVHAPHQTQRDKKKGIIYSLATQIYYKEPQPVKYEIFSILIRQLLHGMPMMTEKTRQVIYAYSITHCSTDDCCKVNIFMTID